MNTNSIDIETLDLEIHKAYSKLQQALMKGEDGHKVNVLKETVYSLVEKRKTLLGSSVLLN